MTTPFKIDRAKVEYQHEDESAELPLRTKSGEPIIGKEGRQAKLLVIGEQSKEYKRRDHEIQKRHLKARRSADPARIEAIGIERIAAGVVGFVDLTDDDGKDIPYSHENAIFLLRELPHEQDDVAECLKEHHRFFSSASTS